MEMLGVPTLGIGDELPDFAAETLTGKLIVHDWVLDAQSHKDGEEVYTLVLTFPGLQNPVSASEFAWLGSPETHALLAARMCRVLCVCTTGLYELKTFLSDVPELLDVEDFSLSGGGSGGGDVVEVLCDEDGEYQRLLGCVRPGSEDASRGRVPSLLSLVVNPRKEILSRSEYASTSGRNFMEMLRSLDSMRVTQLFPRLGTWANWQAGGQEGMLVLPSLEDGSVLSDEECDHLFPKGKFECLFPWFRITPVPDLPGGDNGQADGQLAVVDDG